MAKTNKKSVFEEINEFVNKYGTGIHKGGEIYNKTVYFRVLEFLYDNNNENAFTGVERVRSFNCYQLDIKELYYDLIPAIIEDYDPEAGMTFVSYVIQRLIWKIQDKNNKIDGGAYIKYVSLKDDDIEDMLIKAIDDKMIKEQGIKENDSGLLREEQFEIICDLLYDIMRVIADHKRTKGEVFRIFYTDLIMKSFIDYQIERKKEFRHEKQIFDNLERQLVDYVFTEAVTSLRGMSNTDLKTIKELMEYYSDLEEDKKEVEKKYLSVWGIEEKKHPEYRVKLPLSKAILLAYLFIKEYEQSMRRVIPKPHKASYFSNYSKEFKKLIDSFFTLEIKEMYG